MKGTVLVLVGLMALAGCDAGVGASPTPEQTVAPTTSTPDSPQETPPVSDVPQSVLDQILDDASDRSGMPQEQLQIVRAEAVTWPDASLGCPEPGVMYIQVLTDGFWVEVSAGDQMLDYRGTGREFRFCPPGQGNPPR